MASSHRYGMRRPDRSRPKSSSLSASRPDTMALTWSFDSLSMPIAAAALATLRVLVPVAYISLTAAASARSTLW